MGARWRRHPLVDACDIIYIIINIYIWVRGVACTIVYTYFTRISDCIFRCLRPNEHVVVEARERLGGPGPKHCGWRMSCSEHSALARAPTGDLSRIVHHAAERSLRSVCVCVLSCVHSYIYARTRLWDAHTLSKSGCALPLVTFVHIPCNESAPSGITLSQRAAASEKATRRRREKA